MQIKLAQTIEQGMGRHIRGEKDYGVVILIGPHLIKAVRSQQSRRFFSAQTKQQIEIGLEIAEMAEEELTEKKEPWTVLVELIRQCVSRDEVWKQYYQEKMDGMPAETKRVNILDILVSEKTAEDHYQRGDIHGAIKILQKLVDDIKPSNEERGWYLQEMARYTYALSKLESNRLQVAAHKQNPYLLRPKEGMVIEKLSPVGQRRIENIVQWMRNHVNAEDLILKVDEILEGLHFGVDSDRFEMSFNDLGTALGFPAQRPDKQWKAGPDNLWSLRDNEYLLVECKSEVNALRKEIHKDETGQMNNAYAWFSEIYPGCKVHCTMIIPAKECAEAAGFNAPVRVMREGKLRSLRNNVKKFFGEFRNVDLADLSKDTIEKALTTHHLDVVDVVSLYSEQTTRRIR